MPQKYRPEFKARALRLIEERIRAELCSSWVACTTVGEAFGGISPHTLSSPGFCGGWFIWCRWWLVVIVPGGGGRVPRRLRARRGYASRWRSVAGWCPYRWTHSAVATTGGVDVLPKAPVTDQLGLAQRAQRLGQSKAERRSPFDPTEATASHSDRAAP